MRLRPADLSRIATWNAENSRARRAYAADAFAHLTPRRTCACGAYTRSDDGICRRCRKDPS